MVMFSSNFVESYQKELASIKSILKKNPRGMTVSDISRKMKINRNDREIFSLNIRNGSSKIS